MIRKDILSAIGKYRVLLVCIPMIYVTAQLAFLLRLFSNIWMDVGIGWFFTLIAGAICLGLRRRMKFLPSLATAYLVLLFLIGVYSQATGSKVFPMLPILLASTLILSSIIAIQSHYQKRRLRFAVVVGALFIQIVLVVVLLRSAATIDLSRNVDFVLLFRDTGNSNKQTISLISEVETCSILESGIPVISGKNKIGTLRSFSRSILEGDAICLCVLDIFDGHRVYSGSHFELFDTGMFDTKVIRVLPGDERNAPLVTYDMRESQRRHREQFIKDFQ